MGFIVDEVIDDGNRVSQQPSIRPPEDVHGMASAQATGDGCKLGIPLIHDEDDTHVPSLAGKAERPNQERLPVFPNHAINDARLTPWIVDGRG
jgi:hypothetical protein